MATVIEQCKTGKPIYGGITDLGKLKENLQQNCIPEGFEFMDINNYTEFLAKRRELMAEKIREYYRGAISYEKIKTGNKANKKKS